MLVLLSVVAAVWLADFPNNHPTLLIGLPLLVAAAGTGETARCMRPRWSFHHAGVMLCLYMDLMALSIIAFLLLYPYGSFLASAG